MSLIEKARAFATAAHGAIGQKRKHTDEPYINHPAAVVRLLLDHRLTDESMICAAWMHDVVEDCPVDLSEIRAMFSAEIADLVWVLTDTPTVKGGMNRAARKGWDRLRLADAPAAAQNIKCADLIDNTKSIVEHDPNFAKVYMREKRELLKALTKADEFLWLRAQKQVEAYFR